MGAWEPCSTDQNGLKMVIYNLYVVTKVLLKKREKEKEKRERERERHMEKEMVGVNVRNAGNWGIWVKGCHL